MIGDTYRMKIFKTFAKREINIGMCCVGRSKKNSWSP